MVYKEMPPSGVYQMRNEWADCRVVKSVIGLIRPLYLRHEDVL